MASWWSGLARRSFFASLLLLIITLLVPSFAAASAGASLATHTYESAIHGYDATPVPVIHGSESASRHRVLVVPVGVSLGDSVSVLPVGVATNAAPPRFITTGAGTTIDRLAVNTTISAQRQGRHVLGARQYGGGSYFNSADDAQGVLDAFHSGSAQVLGTKGNDIVVRVPGITGFNHNPGAGFPNQATNVFFIKGSSSPSVVPYNPAWKP